MNTDIVLRGDLTVLQHRKAPFLVIGESLDVDVRTSVRFGDLAWRRVFAAGGRSRGPFAIINADIELASSSEAQLARCVAALEPDVYLLGQRTDRQMRGGRVHEKVFPFGFDFMAFHGSRTGRLEGLLSPALQLGRP